MRPITHDLITRPFAEVVGDLLVAVSGGVVNEPIRFDVKAERYSLAEPSSGIRSVTGVFEERHFEFQNEVDFEFSDADNALIWRETGTRPDDDTVFYVDYHRQFSNSPLTDLNVGSVTRTVMESISREIAFLYSQINLAYLSGFFETAEGKSLDLVVSILGIQRRTAEFADGLETFFRDEAAGDGNVTIPANALLRTTRGNATFVTTQPRTLQRGQSRIDVPIRATEASRGEDGVVDAGAISELVQPITGISRVTNFDPTIKGEKDETDDELRARARAVVQSLGKATLAAIKRVINENRAELVEHWDPNGEPGKQSALGELSLLINVKPGRFESLRGAVEETRAAGVLVNLLAKYIFVRPKLTATIDPGLTAAGKLKVQQQIVNAFLAYTESLEAGEPAQSVEMAAFVTEDRIDGQPNAFHVAEVQTLQFHDVAVEKTDLNQAANGGGRTADRGLLQNLEGGQAQDADIDAGEFQVSATPNGEDGWFVVLDMVADEDILLQEG